MVYPGSLLFFSPMGSRNLSFRRFVLQAVAVLKVVCSCFLPGEIMQEKDQNEHVKKFKASLKDVSVQLPGNHWSLTSFSLE